MWHGIRFFLNTTLVLMGLMALGTEFAINLPQLIAKHEGPIPFWVIWITAAITAYSVTIAASAAKKDWS